MNVRNKGHLLYPESFILLLCPPQALEIRPRQDANYVINYHHGKSHVIDNTHGSFVWAGPGIRLRGRFKAAR